MIFDIHSKFLIVVVDIIKLLINEPRPGFWKIGLNNFSKKNLDINAY